MKQLLQSEIIMSVFIDQNGIKLEITCYTYIYLYLEINFTHQRNYIERNHIYIRKSSL